jgi:hypothetical protein
MGGLFRGPSFAIQRQTHHQSLDSTLLDQGLQPFQIRWKFAAGQGPQRGDGDSKGVTASKANAPAPHIQRQGRSGQGSGGH